MANTSPTIVISNKHGAIDGLLTRLRPATPAGIRIAALRRFATGITLLSIAGHAYLGFEQSFAQPIVAVLVCYLTELFMESLTAFGERRRPIFSEPSGSPLSKKVITMVDFLLPAHISGLALGMLLYMSDRLDLFVIAAVIAISSKYCFRVSNGQRSSHFFNPSNFGIAVMILLFPETVSIAPPYQFTESLGFGGDIALPIVVACIGLFLNAVFTSRLPLIAAWIFGFVLQAAIRSGADSSVDFAASVSPLTGMAILLFTLYMLTDPGTTPRSTRGQIFFGLAVALVYGALMSTHAVFGVFIALMIVCACRGLWLAALNWRSSATGVSQSSAAPSPSLDFMPQATVTNEVRKNWR